MLLARVFLAVVFGLATATKLHERTGGRQALMDFGVPHWVATPSAVVLPVLEGALAAMLLVPQTARLAGIGAVVLLATFLVAMLIAVAHGRAPDCHCFGTVYSSRVGGRSIARNALLTSAGALVIISPPSIPTVNVVGALIVVATLATLLNLRTPLAQARWSIPVSLRRPWPRWAPGQAFDLPTVTGDRVTLRSLLRDGKPVLLIFTSPTCPACSTLMPDIAEWQQRWRERLTIAVIAGASPSALEQHQTGVRIMLADEEQRVISAYGVHAVPAAALVHPDGRPSLPPAAGVEAIRRLVANHPPRGGTGTDANPPAPVANHIGRQPRHRGPAPSAVLPTFHHGGYPTETPAGKLAARYTRRSVLQTTAIVMPALLARPARAFMGSLFERVSATTGKAPPPSLTNPPLSALAYRGNNARANGIMPIPQNTIPENDCDAVNRYAEIAGVMDADGNYHPSDVANPAGYFGWTTADFMAQPSQAQVAYSGGAVCIGDPTTGCPAVTKSYQSYGQCEIECTSGGGVANPLPCAFNYCDNHWCATISVVGQQFAWTGASTALHWQPTRAMSPACQKARDDWERRIADHEAHHASDFQKIAQDATARWAGTRTYTGCAAAPGDALQAAREQLDSALNNELEKIRHAADASVNAFHNTPAGNPANGNIDCSACHDVTPPRVTIKSAKLQRTPAGWVLHVTPSETSTVSASATVTLNGGGRLRLSASPRKAFAHHAMGLKLTAPPRALAAVRRALARHRVARTVITLTAVDTVGNRTTVKRTIELR